MRKTRESLAPNLPYSNRRTYAEFDALNGYHPWQDAIPNSYMLYPARTLPQGRVLYFNFALAREMGLIENSHDPRINSELESKLVETFCLQIINEYDQHNGRQFPKNTLKKNPYMATRYLQLQHNNKQGRTSGDGRSIWNGSFTKNGKSWDVSSRGTGVTALAPGAVEAQKPIRSGDETFGYGCGMADVDELISSSIMSEVLHHLGIPTERMLAVIDIGKNLAIGVRAAPNLMRPAHVFLHLKQNNREMIRKSMDWFLRRQVENKRWNIPLKSKGRYDLLLSYFAKSYAEFAARLEREYVFCWLDWDGDNCLADAAILDYGSVRVFGLRHDQYRYDDVQRYSTNLNEQRAKARLIVQVFAQAVSFLKTGRRRTLQSFKNHPSCLEFDRLFEQNVRRFLLLQAGFSDQQATHLMRSRQTLVKDFERHFVYFEQIKTQRKTEKLADGINKPAVFNMRKFLRNLPTTLAKQNFDTSNFQEYFSLMQSRSASKRDQRFRKGYNRHLRPLIATYVQMLKYVDPKISKPKIDKIARRAQINCRPHRLTGNSTEYAVWELLKFRKRNQSAIELQQIIDAFIAEQTLSSEEFQSKFPAWHKAIENSENSTAKYATFRNIMRVIRDFDEDI